jgi:hypothetical protein
MRRSRPGPEPPAAPAEFIVGPPAAQGDADGQKHPGNQGPGARPACPCGIQFATDQGGEGKTERNGQADIAHVEHGRVHRQSEVLQQRVQVTAFQRYWKDALERIGCEQQERQETDADHAHHRQYPRHNFRRQGAAEQGNGYRPATQDQRPQ